MKADLATAVVKDGDYTDDEKISMEREIRRYVKKGGARKDQASGRIMTDGDGNTVYLKGGWRKGITDAQKKRCIVFLTRLGRDTTNPKWDESVPVPGFIARN